MAVGWGWALSGKVHSEEADVLSFLQAGVGMKHAMELDAEEKVPWEQDRKPMGLNALVWSQLDRAV